MENPLISVIVPIYKVEPYLRRCLDSIVNQTYANLEIILVDDGSLDGCPAICDEYATKDNRIIVVHKENGGLSDARNAGLDICKGEYITFVDSDDWIADCFVEILIKTIQENKAELAICKYIQTASNFSSKIEASSLASITLSSIEATKKLWSNDETTFVTAWGKLYKSTLWHNLKFPKGLLHEDEYTTYKVLYSATKTVFLDIPLYYYFQRSDSIMAGARPSSIRVLKARWERYVYFKEANEHEISDLCLQPLCWDLLFAYSQIKLSQESIVGFENGNDILKRFNVAVSDLVQRHQTNQFHLTVLKLLSKIPSLYIFYRKFFPAHLREI